MDTGNKYIEFEGEQYPEFREDGGVIYKFAGIERNSDGTLIIEYAEVLKDEENKNDNRARLEHAVNSSLSDLGYNCVVKLSFL